jgi:hypothetical protein
MAHNFRGRNYGYNRYARYQFINELEKGRRGNNINSNNTENFPWAEAILLAFLLFMVFSCFISSHFS